MSLTLSNGWTITSDNVGPFLVTDDHIGGWLVSSTNVGPYKLSTDHMGVHLITDTDIGPWAATCTSAPLFPAPIGWWTLNEGTGSTAGDSSGNSRTGTLTGDEGWQPAFADPNSGNVNSLAPTGQTADYVDIPIDDTIANLGVSTSFTVCAWVYIETFISGNAWAVSTVMPDQSGGWCFGSLGAAGSPPNVVDLTFAGSDGGHVSSTTVPESTWTHIAGVFDIDAGTVSLYINGEPDINNPIAATSVVPSTNDLWLGGNADGETWSGTMDQVVIFDQTLTDAQVLAIYNGTEP